MEPTDPGLVRDLSALSPIYRTAATEVPPPALDDAIRAAARRAVNARPQSRGKTWITRWSGPFATAAVLVLAVSIGIFARRETPVPVSAETSAPDDRTSAGVLPMSRGAPDSVASVSRRAEASTAPALQLNSEKGLAAPVPPALGREPARSALTGRSAPAEAAISVEAQAPPAAKMPDRLEKMDVSASPASAAAAPRGLSASDARARAAIPEIEFPLQWIARIRQMRAEGKVLEAEESLKQFRLRYPDYALPDDLAHSR